MHESKATAPPRPHAPILPSALEAFDEVILRLGDKEPALFLDFDGTLAPIVPHPAQARLEPGTRAVLERLARRMSVGVISGRSVKDVKDRLGVEGVQIVGDHGLVFLEGDDKERLAPPVSEDHLMALDATARRIEERIAPVDGAFVERKRCTFAVHTRQVDPQEKPKVHAAVDQILSGEDRLQAERGKEVVDVRPRVSWDKGSAIREMIRRLETSKRRLLPVVMGDDVGDEPAFRAVREEGICVIVGDPARPTAALYRLAGPTEVQAFLGLLHERTRARPGAPAYPGITRRGPDL